MNKSRNLLATSCGEMTFSDTLMTGILRTFFATNVPTGLRIATGYLPLISDTVELNYVEWAHWCGNHTMPGTLIVLRTAIAGGGGGYFTEIYERQHPAQGGEWKRTTHYYIQPEGFLYCDAIGAYVGDFHHEYSRAAELAAHTHKSKQEQSQTIFSKNYEAACAGTLPEDFPHWDARSADDDMADHPGITLLHAAASRGNAPLDDWDDPRWQWVAPDGWTVKDAWKQYTYNLSRECAAVSG
jgi:hypothetical protein